MKKLIGNTLLKTSFSCYEQRSRIVGNPKSPCQHAAIIRVKCMMGLLNIYGSSKMWCGEKLSSKKADITNIEPTIFFIIVEQKINPSYVEFSIRGTLWSWIPSFTRVDYFRCRWVMPPVQLPKNWTADNSSILQAYWISASFSVSGLLTPLNWHKGWHS